MFNIIYVHVFSEQICMPDVPDIMTLLQAIGYKVLYCDITQPGEMSLLSNENQGVRVNVSCTHTGLRACLEAPAECRCPPNAQNASFWEVTASGPNCSVGVRMMFFFVHKKNMFIHAKNIKKITSQTVWLLNMLNACY